MHLECKNERNNLAFSTVCDFILHTLDISVVADLQQFLIVI